MRRVFTIQIEKILRFVLFHKFRLEIKENLLINLIQ